MDTEVITAVCNKIVSGYAPTFGELYRIMYKSLIDAIEDIGIKTLADEGITTEWLVADGYVHTIVMDAMTQARLQAPFSEHVLEELSMIVDQLENDTGLAL